LLRLAGGVVITAVLVAGCAANTQVPVDPQVRSKLEGLYVGSAVVEAAQDLVVSRCMARAGFDWAPSEQTDDALPRLYSDDVDAARRNGYGLREEHDKVSRLLALESATGNLPAQVRDARRRALDGDPDDTVETRVGDVVVGTGRSGCRAEARKAVYGSVEASLRYHQLVDDLIRQPLSAAEHHHDVVAALEAWRRCMAERGHRVTDRDDARGTAEAGYDRMDETDAFRMEVRLAVDDAACDRAAGYARVREEAEDAELTDFVRRNEGLVLGAIEAQREALANARRVAR
jgi:hypothetical protein